jgi:methylthioribose-1-phosphate isomerase
VPLLPLRATSPSTLAEMVLQAIKYKRGELLILDQLALPHSETYIATSTAQEAWMAIKTMKVRGAPAIAIVAALALAVELHMNSADSSFLDASPGRTAQHVVDRLRYLVTSRPTAVNLGDAAQKLEAVVSRAAEREGATSEGIVDDYIKAAERMLVDDVQDNENIGREGCEWLLHKSDGVPISVVTHCNTG